MNNKNIIIAGVIAIGLYIFSQSKKIYATTTQKIAQRIRPAAPSTIRQTTAQKVAQKVAQKRIGQPTTQAAQKAAALRAWLEEKRKIRIQKEAAQSARIEQARKIRLQKKVAQKATIRKATAQKIGKKIGKKVAQKATIRKATAQKIGKKIGKKVAQKIPQILKTRRAVMLQHAKTQRPQKQRQRSNKKHTASRLFSGAEKSRIIPYSESSKHSYYGPKSHRLLNEGYGKGKAERDRKQALEFRLNELRALFPQSKL